ncbi:MAG: hypothetical protein U5K73_10330 [Halofilum sp. (in: g-proteobacteria)]|nr:hypothetical protein [Halofilum sp. (in: g-proteobacteria)]
MRTDREIRRLPASPREQFLLALFPDTTLLRRQQRVRRHDQLATGTRDREFNRPGVLEHGRADIQLALIGETIGQKVRRFEGPDLAITGYLPFTGIDAVTTGTVEEPPPRNRRIRIKLDRKLERQCEFPDR